MSKPLQSGFDEFFHRSGRDLLEDRLNGFVDVRFGKTQHLEGCGGFFCCCTGIGLEQHFAAGGIALDNLVLEFEDQPLGCLGLTSSLRMALRISSAVREERIMRADAAPMPDTLVICRKSSRSSWVAKP